MWRHIGEVPVDADLYAEQFDGIYNPAAQKIPAQNYFDLTATAQVTKRFQFRLGVRNLFDREPPIVPTGLFGSCSGAGTCNGNTFPQLYDPAGRFIFAGARINLF
jgi:outer membrane receptor protein involved in Fe transport